MKRMKSCQNDTACIGYYVDGNGMVGTFQKDETKSFCQVSGSMVVAKNLTKQLESKNCQHASSSEKEMQDFWMPNVEYKKLKCPDGKPNCDSLLRQQCEKETELDGFYSWNEKSNLCGISSSNSPTICKASGSGFTTYSKKKECESKNCQKVDGKLSIL